MDIPHCPAHYNSKRIGHLLGLGLLLALSMVLGRFPSALKRSDLWKTRKAPGLLFGAGRSWESALDAAKVGLTLATAQQTHGAYPAGDDQSNAAGFGNCGSLEREGRIEWPLSGDVCADTQPVRIEIA